MSAPSPRRALAVRIAVAGFLSATALATGACGTTEPEPQNTFEQQALAHEALIQECMRGRGYEYVVGLAPDAVAEIARQEATAEGEDGEAAYEQALAAAPEDPNEALVAALPEDEQVLWGDALYGTDTVEGCYDLTYAEAWGVDYAALTEQMNAFNAKVRAEPDVIAAAEAYTGCMAAAGYAVPHPDQVEAVIDEQFAVLEGEAAESYATAVQDAHQVCVVPYDEAFTVAYERVAAAE